MNKFKTIIYSTIFSFLPSISFANSDTPDVDKLIVVLKNLIETISISISKGILIFTAVQITYFFISNKYSSYKLYESLRLCVIVLLCMYLLPNIPNILRILI